MGKPISPGRSRSAGGNIRMTCGEGTSRFLPDEAAPGRDPGEGLSRQYPTAFAFSNFTSCRIARMDSRPEFLVTELHPARQRAVGVLLRPRYMQTGISCA